MRTARASTPRTTDVLLLVGVALFVGGLTVFVGGLRSPAEPAPAAVPGARAVAVAEDPGRLGAGLARIDIQVLRPAVRGAGGGARRHPVPHRPVAHVPQDRAACAGQASPGPVSVGWSSQWHLTLMGDEDDGRDYLTRTANARRSARRNRLAMGWEDSTGYRAVEAGRAASDFAKGSPPATSELGRNRTPSGPENRHAPITVDPARFSIGSEC